MRKGKSYHMLQPSCLAPDMPGYGGLPRFATATMQVRIGDGLYDFSAPADKVFPEVIPMTWEVRYHIQATAGVYELDATVKVFPQFNEPGAHAVVGGILQDGSLFLVEKTITFDGDLLNHYGVIQGYPPWKAAVFNGVIQDFTGFRLDYVRYRDEP